MNGTFTGFTNIVSRPDQYIVLDADGKLMGKGNFTATWKLPVDSLNDRFLLNARLDSFDLTAVERIAGSPGFGGGTKWMGSRDGFQYGGIQQRSYSGDGFSI